MKQPVKGKLELKLGPLRCYKMVNCAIALQ